MRAQAIILLAIVGLVSSGCATQSGGISNCVVCFVNMADNSTDKQEAPPPDSKAPGLLATVAGAFFARK